MDVSYIQASKVREKLCILLYFCRGANAIVLTQYYNRSLQYTTQQKKQISNQLARLKEAGIINSKRLEGKNAGSMYYLSPTGLELVQRLLNIAPLQSGTMWQKYPLTTINPAELKEYDYESYIPPIRQHSHHHLILKSIVSLFGEGANNSNSLFRYTLDATEKYMYKQQECLLKPDVEIKVGEEIYTLEIDRSTESYYQLVEKFKNYKNYYDYAEKEETASKITKIIFVYDDKNSKHGISRRWETIMKAYLEGMGIKVHPSIDWPKIELLYVNVGDLSQVVEYVQLRNQLDLESYITECFEKQYPSYLYEGLNEFTYFKDGSMIAITKENKQFVMILYCPFYTSNFYRLLLEFKKEREAKYNNYTKPLPIIITAFSKEHWTLNWKQADISYDLKYELDFMFNLTQYLLYE